MDKELRTITGVISFVIGCLILFIMWTIQESEAERMRWETFKAQHDCQKVAFISGDVIVSPTIVPGPKGTVSVG